MPLDLLTLADGFPDLQVPAPDCGPVFALWLILHSCQVTDLGVKGPQLLQLVTHHLELLSHDALCLDGFAQPL